MFTPQFAPRPTKTIALDPTVIGERRDEWVDEWRSIAGDAPVTTGRSRRGRSVAVVAAVALWAAFYGWPVVAIIRRSLAGVAGQPGLSFSTVGDVLSDGRVGRLALWSVSQCVVSTLLVLVLGRADRMGARTVAVPRSAHVGRRHDAVRVADPSRSQAP